MPAEAFQCCCEGVCQGRMARWYWGRIKPQTAGGKKKQKTRVNYIMVIAIGLEGVSFLTPNLALGLTLHGWGKTNWLSMWEASQCWEEFPTSSSPFPAQLYQRSISALSIQGEVLWVPKPTGQKENIISCGPYCSWSKSEKSPLLCLLPVRDKRASLGRVTAQGFH